MSKRRQIVPEFEGEIEGPVADDAQAWVVFTQLKPEGPYLYAGYVEAVDLELAKRYTREHYGQDQPATAYWIIDRKHIVGTDLREPDDRGGEPRRWVVLVQPEPGDVYRTPTVSTERTVEAATSGEAIIAARKRVAGAGVFHGIWVVPESCVIPSEEGELLWRHVDQGYRLARGYSKGVREKWETIRERQAIEEYEKDDLEETFVDR